MLMFSLAIDKNLYQRCYEMVHFFKTSRIFQVGIKFEFSEKKNIYIATLMLNAIFNE